MNIGIFGQHPDVKPGFNSAMTMNWILGFGQSSCVNKITLYINTEFKIAGDLNFWGVSVDLIYIAEGENFSNQHDVLIWQTYHQEDHKKFWGAYSSGDYLKVKNFPRFFSGDFNYDKTRLKKISNAFDVIMFSLEEDYKIARTYHTLNDSQYAFVPRGFPARFLKKESRDDQIFRISVDVRKRNGVEQGDFDVFSNAIQLISTNRKIELLVLGKRINNARMLKRCSTLGFYSDFINKSDLYAFVDRNKSYTDHHLNPGGKSVYCGVYENTIVEAQMSGLMVIGPKKIIPEEMISNGYNGLLLDDDTCPRKMADAISYCINNSASLSNLIRQDRVRRNALPVMSKRFIEAIKLS